MLPFLKSLKNISVRIYKYVSLTFLAMGLIWDYFASLNSFTFADILQSTCVNFDSIMVLKKRL